MPTLLFPALSSSCPASTCPTFCLADCSLGFLWPSARWPPTRWPASNDSSKPASDSSNGSVYPKHKNQQGSNKSAHTELSCTDSNQEGQTHKYRRFRCAVPGMPCRQWSRVRSRCLTSPPRSQRSSSGLCGRTGYGQVSPAHRAMWCTQLWDGAGTREVWRSSKQWMLPSKTAMK